MSIKTSSILQPPATPKRRQVADRLRQMIATLQSGDRLPSVSELEKHFGFAKSTVEGAVSDLQAEGLIVRRHGAGTFVADRTGSGGSHHSRSSDNTAAATRPRVGRLMITSLPLGQSLDIFAAMMASLEMEMRRLNYDPILHFETNPALRLIRAQERWDARNIDGYVHIGSFAPNISFPSVPGVVVGEVSAEARVHQVSVDNYEAGRRAGHYLWGLGHRRIAMIAMYNLVPGTRRYQGLVDALRESGGHAEEVLFVPIGGTKTAQGGYPSLEDALGQATRNGSERPTAFFFANDYIAFPALQILLSWGIRIPDDLSVLSFDDTPGLASQTRPALTSMRMPAPALGALAVQTLHQAVTETELPFRHLSLPAELIIRESTGPAPGSLPVPPT